MKKFGLVIIAVLLAVGVLVVGCTAPAQTTPPTFTQPPLSSYEGTITGVNPDIGEITIMTAQGERTLKVNAGTGIVLNGQVCTLDELSGVVAAGGPPKNCVVYFVAYPEDNYATAIAVQSETPPTEGTVTGVNPQKNEIAIMTDQGVARTVKVDPQTDIILSGQICTLAELAADVAAGGPHSCVVYLRPYPEDDYVAVIAVK